MALPDPTKCYPAIYNDTRDLYSKIIRDFVETFGDVYLHSNTYEDLISKKIINEVLRGGLPVDCVLRAAPLTDQVREIIEQSTVYTPDGRVYDNYEDFEGFVRAKTALSVRVGAVMRDILKSLKNERKMPENLRPGMQRIRDVITKKFIREKVFVDTLANEWWREERREDKIAVKMLDDAILKVVEMMKRIAGLETIQLVVHWGQWAFRVSEGLDHIESKKLVYI